MNSKRQRKLTTILFSLLLLSMIAALVLYSLKQNISLFFSPSQVYSGNAPLNQPIRLGGMVEKGSVKRAHNGLQVDFKITDYEHTLVVEYHGILPDLFREGQGVVVEGHLKNNNHFTASRVLAKHDENYMPPEVRQTLKSKAQT